MCMRNLRTDPSVLMSGKLFTPYIVYTRIGAHKKEVFNRYLYLSSSQKLSKVGICGQFITFPAIEDLKESLTMNIDTEYYAGKQNIFT